MNRPIPTKDANGVPTGFLLPIWNVLADDWRPDQVYVTAVYPKGRKGPHLHLKREGRFCCVFGDVTIVTREDGAYREHHTGQMSGHKVVHVPAGVPAAIYNQGCTTALVLNLPSPAWSPEDQDEHFVESWNYDPRK